MVEQEPNKPSPVENEEKTEKIIPEEVLLQDDIQVPPFAGPQQEEPSFQRLNPEAVRQQLLIASQTLNQVEVGLRVVPSAKAEQARKTLKAAIRNVVGALVEFLD